MQKVSTGKQLVIQKGKFATVINRLTENGKIYDAQGQNFTVHEKKKECQGF